MDVYQSSGSTSQNKGIRFLLGSCLSGFVAIFAQRCFNNVTLPPLRPF